MLLHDLQENRGYLKLKEEALNRTLWGTQFVRNNGHFVRQFTEWMNELHVERERERERVYIYIYIYKIGLEILIKPVFLLFDVPRSVSDISLSCGIASICSLITKLNEHFFAIKQWPQLFFLHTFQLMDLMRNLLLTLKAVRQFLSLSSSQSNTRALILFARRLLNHKLSLHSSERYPFSAGGLVLASWENVLALPSKVKKFRTNIFSIHKNYTTTCLEISGINSKVTLHHISENGDLNYTLVKPKMTYKIPQYSLCF